MSKIINNKSIDYNQYWIDKAITEGNMNFIPVKKFPNKSIGEHIEIKYKQLHNEEFNKYYHNNKLDYYNHIANPNPKVTKKESLLFTREWFYKYIEEGLEIPNRPLFIDCSLGEFLENYYLNNKAKKVNENKINQNSKKYIRKK